MYKEKDIIAQWCADMYDLNETQTDDVDFLIKLIGNEPKNILEIACGSGRIMIPLINHCHNVTGYDFDEFMLKKISNKIISNKLKCYKKDVILDNWETDFDIVILGANFLYNIVSEMNYEEAQKLIISKASQSLKSGGYVFIDCGYTMFPEQWFNNPNENIVFEGKDSQGNYGKMSLLNSKYDSITRINTFIRKFVLKLVNGETITQEIPSKKHFASINQIKQWLIDSGFIIKIECGDYHFNPISESTNRAIIWAKKN